jgi:uncharacterized metal-binding protein YceD (DUF177 family)
MTSILPHLQFYSNKTENGKLYFLVILIFQLENDENSIHLPPVFWNKVMKPLKEYRIPFLGLKPGQHEYEFEMTDTFFEEFENSEIEHADIQVDLILEKQTNMMVLQFELSGEVLSACDRCGDELKLPIHSSEKLVVKLGEQTSATDDDVIVLGPQEFELDISQYLYEYAHLALPFRHVHENIADCNQEVLKELEKYKVDKTSNTQWADLKNLNYEDPEDQEFFNEEEE